MLLMQQCSFCAHFIRDNWRWCRALASLALRGMLSSDLAQGFCAWMWRAGSDRSALRCDPIPRGARGSYAAPCAAVPLCCGDRPEARGIGPPRCAGQGNPSRCEGCSLFVPRNGLLFGRGVQVQIAPQRAAIPRASGSATLGKWRILFFQDLAFFANPG